MCVWEVKAHTRIAYSHQRKELFFLFGHAFAGMESLEGEEEPLMWARWRSNHTSLIDELINGGDSGRRRTTTTTGPNALFVGLSLGLTGQLGGLQLVLYHHLQQVRMNEAEQQKFFLWTADSQSNCVTLIFFQGPFVYYIQPYYSRISKVGTQGRPRPCLVFFGY